MHRVDLETGAEAAVPVYDERLSDTSTAPMEALLAMDTISIQNFNMCMLTITSPERLKMLDAVMLKSKLYHKWEETYCTSALIWKYVPKHTLTAQFEIPFSEYTHYIANFTCRVSDPSKLEKITQTTLGQTRPHTEDAWVVAPWKTKICVHLKHDGLDVPQNLELHWSYDAYQIYDKCRDALASIGQKITVRTGVNVGELIFTNQGRPPQIYPFRFLN
jgi:hypothetical protein